MRYLMMRVAVLSIVVLIAAQPCMAGAPLKGVDVKLGRNPGGTMRTVKTDADGKLDLGVLPAGSYYLDFTPAKGTPVEPILATIELTGTAKGAVTYQWDRKSGSIVFHDRNETAKAAKAAKDKDKDKEQRITFESDGTHPVNGTIVKSKSNISNN